MSHCCGSESMNSTGCFCKSTSFFFKKLEHQLSKFQLIRSELPCSDARSCSYIEDAREDEAVYGLSTSQDWNR